MHTLGTTADLLESETLEVRSINSVVPSALRVVPTCTQIGEPLQMQAAWGGAELGDSGKATCPGWWGVGGGCGPFHGFTSQWVLGSEPGLGVSFQAYGTLVSLPAVSAALCQIQGHCSLPELRLRIPCLSSHAAFISCPQSLNPQNLTKISHWEQNHSGLLIGGWLTPWSLVHMTKFPGSELEWKGYVNMTEFQQILKYTTYTLPIFFTMSVCKDLAQVLPPPKSFLSESALLSVLCDSSRSHNAAFLPFWSQRILQ